MHFLEVNSPDPPEKVKEEQIPKLHGFQKLRVSDIDIKKKDK